MNEQYRRLREKFAFTKDEFIERAKKVHGVTLLHYSNVKTDFPYTVYTNIEELIKKASENKD